MKIIDNFNLLSEKLFSSPLGEGEFYFVQILVRGKDGQNVSGRNNKNRLVRFYVVRSKEKLLELKEEIVMLCRLHNARAYIHATPREDKAVATEMLKDAVNEFTVGNYHVFRRLFSTACGRVYSTKKKTFLVDLDDENAKPENVQLFREILTSCRGKNGPNMNKIIVEVPTKNGLHLICSPFDIGQFEDFARRNWLEIPDVHKNNPTLLYFETKD
jgi:hypothetical protein